MEWGQVMRRWHMQLNKCQGHHCIYGKGKTVDTSKKFTVVSRFEQNKLTQFFVQDGKKIDIPPPTFDGIPKDSSNITPEFCTNQFKTFGDRDRFAEVGGFAQLNAALAVPMVLVMSIWDDHYANMLWLDSSYPPEKTGQPGGDRGSCSADSGVPADVESKSPNSKVIYSNIRFGPVGSTVSV